MSVGGVTASNGVFTITDANGKTETVDLGTLMMMLNLDRTKNLDDQLAMQFKEMQERNETIRELTAFLSEARKRQAAGEDDENGWTSTKVQPKKGGGGKLNPDGIIEQMGLSWTDVGPSDSAEKKKATWEANINSIKSKIDTLNNDSQLANIRLQNILEKRNNAFEMATKVMDTNNQSIQSTIRNL